MLRRHFVTRFLAGIVAVGLLAALSVIQLRAQEAEAVPPEDSAALDAEAQAAVGDEAPPLPPEEPVVAEEEDNGPGDEDGALASPFADLAEGAIADFASDVAAIDVSDALAGTRVSDPAEPGAAWFTIYVENSGEDLVPRVLQAIDPPAAGFNLTPPSRRPTLIEVAGSDSAVIIQQADAFGENAYRIILPPSYETALALHFDGVGPAPTLLAWTESALIAHNRQMSLLVGVIGGLMLAAVAVAGGAATLLGRKFAIWATLFLGANLFAFLTSVRVFDDSFVMAFGGPYGLFALFLALAVASGSRLIDHVASYEAFWPPARRSADWAAIAILVLGIVAWFGLPLAGALVRVLAVLGAAGAAGYLTHCGRLGVAGARRLAPAATIFALITAVATFRATGLLGTGVMASTVIAGFAAIGAILVALTAAVASAEPSVLRLRAMRWAHIADDIQATTTDESLAESREHAAVIASHQGIFDLDMDSALLSLSAEAARMFGIGERAMEIAHDDWLRNLFPDDRDIYLEALSTYKGHPDSTFRVEFRAKRPGGEIDWYELRATMTGQATEPDRCLGLVANVTARKANETAVRTSQFDELTGLGNRLALFAALDEAKDHLGELALMVFDLDRFKEIDNTLGKDGGDLLLRKVAERLDKSFRKTGKVFRIGGDMFAIATPAQADLAQLGEDALKSMAKPFSVEGRDIFLRMSVGVASGEMADDVQDLLSKAELAMVQAKRDGGDCIGVYSETAKERDTAGEGDPIALDTNLRHALERGEIEIHYQPIMRVSDGAVAGFEALLRWKHPEYGLIEPDEFIPYAERVGLIVPLGKLALVRAAEDLARWQHFFPLDTPLFASVNVSWRQIETKSFAGDFKTILAQNALAPHTLRLEVTESAIMRGAKSASASLQKLRTLGAGLAIDDFGTGHSSLAHLRRFPFDVVKIDKSFLAAGEKETTIFASMVKLAHELKLEVVAEGVESEEDVHRLRELGCEYAQGYFFSPPLPASDIPNFIAMTYAS